MNLVEISELKNDRVSVLKGHSHSVTKLAFSNNTMYLISGSMDDTVRIWNVEMKEELFKLETGSPIFGLVINR